MRLAQVLQASLHRELNLLGQWVGSKVISNVLEVTCGFVNWLKKVCIIEAFLNSKDANSGRHFHGLSMKFEAYSLVNYSK